MGSINIDMFPASYGDSFLVKCMGEKNSNILIDMGFKSTYKNYINKELIKLNKAGEKISLLVFTHIDEDHILGGIDFIEKNGIASSPNIIEIDEIWHNSYRHLQFDKREQLESEKKMDNTEASILRNIIDKGYIREKGVRDISDVGYKKGSTLSGILYKNIYNAIWNNSFNNNAIKIPDDGNLPIIVVGDNVKLTLLSPNKEKLKELDSGWRKKLTELGFSEQIEKSEIMDDAFEIYNANLSIKKKKERSISNVSGRAIDFEEIANGKFQPDKTVVNGSSISFILEFQNKKILFLGDSHTDIIVENLKKILLKNKEEKLFFDAVKISHHGSKHNTSNDLLELIRTPRYLISTNGKGRGFNHPDLETLCRIITSNPEIEKELIFNFKPVHLFDHINEQDLKKKYNYKIRCGNNQPESNTHEKTSIII
ncbi:MBL fold metallo-hydrolase [Metabacillus indicus]|uniref:MBL fold metallo-hydrolase n=1 Tax=Metabacillus indicus TaxID=246786 RepID=UPI003CE6DB9E